MSEERLIRVTLDPGHAKNYNRGIVSSYYESNAMYDLSLYLKAELEKYGIFKVFNTKDKLDMCPTLTARGKAAISNNSRLFLSLHTDACGGKAHGVSALATIKTTDTSFAQKLIDATVDLYHKYNCSVTTSRGVIMKKNSVGCDYYGVLRSAVATPGVADVILMEHGFHDNLEECSVLNNTKFLQDLAKAEAKVIYDHYKDLYVSANVKTNVLYTTVPINVRSKPNTSAMVIGMTSPTMIIPVISIDNGWARILWHGCIAYISSAYFTTSITKIPKYSQISNPLPNSTTTTVPEKVNSTFTPSTNYNYLGFGVVTASTLNIRSGPAATYPIIGTTQLNAIIAVYMDTGLVGGKATPLDYSAKWYRINTKDGVGYASSDYITARTEFREATVNTSKLNVRTTPITGDIRTTLDMGATVFVDEEYLKYPLVDGWVRIFLTKPTATELFDQYANDNLYVASKYLTLTSKDTPDKGTVTDNTTKNVFPHGFGQITASTLNVRNQANADGTKIGTLSKGDYIVLEAQVGDWWKIIYQDTYEGYVSKDYVKVILAPNSTLNCTLIDKNKEYAEEVSEGNCVEWFTKVLNGKLTSPYGERTDPVTGAKNVTHGGVDIGAATMTPIVSPIDGIVYMNTFDANGFGNYISVLALDGTKHYFGHMHDKSPLAAGTLICAGTVVGNLGSTGKSTGNHLHYGIKNTKGKWFNPTTYIYPESHNAFLNK